MKPRWIIALFVVCCVAIPCVPLIGLYILHVYQSQIVWQLIDEEILSQPKTVYTKYVTVFQEDNRIYQGSNKPYLVLSDFTARDYRRGDPPYTLQFSGHIINKGGGIAYNGVLHVVAINSEGVAIDADSPYPFGGLTPNMLFQHDFSLKYNGSKIINCTITPIYSDTAR